MANSPLPSSEGNGLPSLDEILQHAKSLILIPIIMAIGFGGFSSFYTVQPEEEAVVKRFGNVIDIKPPGFHFKIPFGIDSVQVVPTARVLKEEFGFR